MPLEHPRSVRIKVHFETSLVPQNTKNVRIRCWRTPCGQMLACTPTPRQYPSTTSSTVLVTIGHVQCSWFESQLTSRDESHLGYVGSHPRPTVPHPPPHSSFFDAICCSVADGRRELSFTMLQSPHKSQATFSPQDNLDQHVLSSNGQHQAELHSHC